ncbi:MAG TPA: hypothetical protein VEX13_17790 [Chloroflexia bacterium]|nr:hypothetical protein [Chloroflexia bacterium]
MSDQLDNRARQRSIGGSAGPVNGGMPTPGANAAMRLVREILARLNSPHAGGAARPLSPTSLWRQVSRRLGYTTEQPQGTHFGAVVPHIDVVHRLHTTHAPSIEDDGWQAPVWPARRPSINVVGQPTPVPLPVPPPIPMPQMPQAPVMQPEMRQISGSPDMAPSSEVASTPVTAPTPAAHDAGTQEVAPVVESGPPVFVPARAIRIEYVPGPAIMPPQPLVAPAPSLARPPIATSFTPAPALMPTPRAQVVVARTAMPGVEAASTDVSAPGVMPAFRSREISQPAEQYVAVPGLAEQSPRLDMPLKARSTVRGAEESSDAYSGGYESVRPEYRPRPAIAPAQPLVSTHTLAERAMGLQVTPPERSLASNVSHDLVPTTDLLSRMESARAAEIMPAPVPVPVPVPAQPQQTQTSEQIQATQQLPEQPAQVGIEQPVQPQARQTISTPVPAMPQPALQMPLAVAPDTRVQQAARPADQTFASPEVAQRGPVATFLGRVMSALPLPEALRRVIEPTPETTQPTEAQAVVQAPVHVQAEVATAPEAPAVSVPAVPAAPAAASPSLAGIEQPAVPVPQSPVVSQQPVVTQTPAVVGQPSASQPPSPSAQVQQVAVAPSVPVSGQVPAVSTPSDMLMPVTVTAGEAVAVVPATPAPPAVEAASGPVASTAVESAPAARSSQGLFGTILSRLLGTSASQREDASQPAPSSLPPAVPRTWARPNNRQTATEEQQFAEQGEAPRASSGQVTARPPQTVAQAQAQPPVQIQEQIVAPTQQEAVAQVVEAAPVAQSLVVQEQAAPVEAVAAPVETSAPVAQVEQPVSYATQQVEQASQETIAITSSEQPGVEAAVQAVYSQPSVAPPIAHVVMPGVEMPHVPATAVSAQITPSSMTEVGETPAVPVAPVAEAITAAPVEQIAATGQVGVEQAGAYSAVVESPAPVTAQPLVSRPETPARRGLFGTLLARLLGRSSEEAEAAPQESHPSIPLEWARPTRQQEPGEAEGFTGQAQTSYVGATRPAQPQTSQGVQPAPTVAQQPPVVMQAEAQAQTQAQVAAYEAQAQADVQAQVQAQTQATAASTETVAETPVVRVELPQPQVSEPSYTQAAPVVVPATPAEDVAVTSQGVVGMAAEAVQGQQVEQTAQAGEQAAGIQAQSAAAQPVETQPSPVASQEGTSGQSWEDAPASSGYTGEAWIILADMAEDVAGAHTPLSSVEPIGMRGGLLARVLGGLGRAFRVAESSAVGSLDAVWRATPVFRNMRGLEGAGSDTGAAPTAGYRAGGVNAPLPAVQTKFGGTLPASAASRAGSGDFAPGAAASDGTPGSPLSGLVYPASAEGGAIGQSQAPLSPFIGQAQAALSPMSQALSPLPLSMTYATLASTGSYRSDVPLSGPQAPVSYLGGTGRRPSVVMRSPGQMSPVVGSYLQAEQPADETESDMEAVSDGVTSWAEILRKIYGQDGGQDAGGEMPLAAPYDGFVVASDGEMASPFAADVEWLGSEPPYGVPGYTRTDSPASGSVATPISMPLPRSTPMYTSSSSGVETTRSYTWTVPGWSADNGSSDSETGAWADVVSSAVQGGYGSNGSQGATAPALAMSPDERGPAPETPEHPNLEDEGDIDSLAESVYAIIRHRIEMERERNG